MSLTPFSSQLIADVGISMGDEGKGRLVYELADELRALGRHPAPVALVLKVNGGANSGHTAAGLKHNLLPVGAADPTIARLAIGSGVVADPRKLWWETKSVEARGYPVQPRLLIDERTMVSDLTHRLLDLAWESYRSDVIGETSRGSTGRGITPAYLEEAGQWQIYFADFLGPKDVFVRKLAQRIDRACRTIEHVCRVGAARWFGFFERLTQAELRANAEAIAAGVFPAQEFDFTYFRTGAPFQLQIERLAEIYWRSGSAFARQIGEVREHVLRALAEGRTVIGEFGQAYWLDKRHGFSPNVTASHTFVPELFQSAGIPVQAVHVVGVCKAYDTKVGTHLFLTEMDPEHPLSTLLRQLEFGTATGRQRKVGWFDAPEKGDALRYGGYHDLVINKLDALTLRGEWRGPLQVCTAYEDATGRRTLHVPRNDAVRRKLRPVWESVPGWVDDISQVRSFAALPEACRRYVATLVRATCLVAGDGQLPARLPNVRYLGVGPEPAQIIKDVPPTTELLALAP